MDELATAQAVARPIGDLGARFMSERATFAKGPELGLAPGLSFYLVGRLGVLGNVAPDVVVASAVFLCPDMVRSLWPEAIAVVPAEKAAALYLETCQRYGRMHYSDVEGLGRFVTLAEAVIDAAAPLNAPIFAGWRSLPRAGDVAGRAEPALHVLRELRMARHAVCVQFAGMTPLEAILSGPGEATARTLGWAEPFPDVTGLAAARARVEAQTDDLSARDFGVLDEAERREFVRLLAAFPARSRS